MKARKHIINTIILIAGLVLSLDIKAQQDTTKLKFSEETLEEPDNKNMKWVRINPGQYNMDDVPAMLKIGTPPLYSTYDAIANYNSIFILDIGYQRKIPTTQLSLEAKIRSNITFGQGFLAPHYSYRSTDDFNESITVLTRNYVSLDMVLRFQPFKKTSMARKKSGDNLYGFYLFAGGLNLVAWQKENETTYRHDISNNQPFREVERRGIGSGPLFLIAGVGYQQRFLKKAYVDIALGISRRKTEISYLRTNAYLELTVGYSIFKVKQ